MPPGGCGRWPKVGFFGGGASSYLGTEIAEAPEYPQWEPRAFRSPALAGYLCGASSDEAARPNIGE